LDLNLYKFYLDCAAVYGNEKEIGIALKNAMEAGKVKREELVYFLFDKKKKYRF